MNKPTYEELESAYKNLFCCAQAVSDQLRDHMDHIIYEGSMNLVEELKYELHEKRWEWMEFLYGADGDDL